MKKLVLTMASVLMLASMTFAQNETPQLPEHHGASDNQPAWGSSQSFDLAAGWNYWSTYVNVSGQSGLNALTNALGNKAMMIKYKGDFLVYENGSWSGTINGVENNLMYAIQMSETSQITLTGGRASVEETPITLTSGWNWIGYPVAIEVAVNDALANYTNAANGELIKTNAGLFAVFESGLGWVGTVETMTPGWGYMLQHNGSETSFYYNTVTAKGRELVTSTPLPTEWQPQMSSNPESMNMIAVVSFDGEELRSDNVEIGVFNGETCRGAVRPIYVEALDQYLVFLTMYGENNEPYQFRLLNHETGEVYESNEASLSYRNNGVVGALRSPFELKFNTKNVANSLNLFPNPVNRGEMVNMTLPGEGVKTVEVVNMLGSTMKSVRMAQGSELSADMAPGIYTIKVTDAEGNVYVDKLIVK